MTFKVPLADRLRLAADKKRRYWSDPAERIKRINMARAYRGAPTITSLDEAGWKPIDRPRDEQGKFVRWGE